MQPIIDRLRDLPFFRALKPETITAIAEAGDWYSVAGGWALYAQGAPSEKLFFLLSGRLIVVRETGNGDDVVGYIRAGEPVGEMSMMSGERHSASVFALRDSEVLMIDRNAFSELIDAHADLVGSLARTSLTRAREKVMSHRRSAPRVFALVAASPSIDVDYYGRELADLMKQMGIKAHFEKVGDAAPDSREFDDLEEQLDVMILAARVEDSAWYKFVLRHSDRFFVFARQDGRPPQPFPLVTQTGERARKFRLVDLVMIHEGLKSCAVESWMSAVSAARVFHIRKPDSLRRLARVIAGRTVGLVLSGGGARAYAHIGAVKALREKGIEIDFVCGASMGAIVAACLAMGWPTDEIDWRLRAAFVESNPLGDHVLPVVALTRGRRVEERLATHFGDALIEELDVPFFCVSSELTQGHLHVHQKGLLRDALRASISLPGILPPIVRGNQLLVDGAVINNFPADILAGLHRGVTIGVDVARKGTIDPTAFADPPSFFRWVRENGLSSAPPVVSLLMRAATARQEQASTIHQADIMITPSVSGVELRDWKKYDQAVDDGYRATISVLNGHDDLLASLMMTRNELS